MLPSWVSSCEIDGYTIFLDIKQNRYTALKSDFGRALLTGDYARLPQRVLDQIASLGWQREDKHNFARVQIEMPTIELSSTAPNPTTVNVLVASAFICQIMTRCRLGTRRFEHVLRSVSGANDRASMRHMRDHAADVYQAETRRPWSAPKATMVSSKRTAAVIDGMAYLAARRQRRIGQHHPDGPLVVFSGGQSWHDYRPIWKALDEMKRTRPTMVLLTTAQGKGGDAIAEAWAARTKTPVVRLGIDTARWGIRGARFGTAWQVRRALWGEDKGSFTIGGIDVPHAFEPEHVLICGAPGTGKTNMIVKMLEGIRAKGKRAIVYDTAGTFVEKFYREKKDILLNPLDERSAVWSPWVDVPKDYHYDQIAESTIPDKHGDPFWPKAARGTLVAVLRKLAAQGRTYVSILLRTVVRSPLKELSAFAAGTDAAAFISTEGERTSAGVQAELASVMRSFAYLDDTEDGLSIRDWVTTEGDDSWLFITVKADQLPSLRPLITVWLDIAISAIMSLKPNRDRRLYCVIDELPSLQKLPSLSDFLARARKYGGCGILGFQSYPQLRATYGKEDAAAITGYCSTWVALRANDTDTAEHVSKNLGQVEQVEANEGMSYGVNDMRDGVNLSRIQVTRPLVMHTEVTNLPNLAGYLRFGRNLPVIRFADKYNRVPSICDAFIERTRPPLRFAAPQEAPAAETNKPVAPRKRSGKQVDNSANPELPLKLQTGPGRGRESGDKGSRGAEGQGATPPASPPAAFEIIAPPWTHNLRQHGRPGGRRRPAKPA